MEQPRDLPPEYEAELRAVAECLADVRRARDILAILTPEEFFCPTLRAVYAAICKVLEQTDDQRESGMVDLIGVLQEWRQLDPETSRDHGLETLEAFLTHAVGLESPARIAKPVKDFALRRRLLAAAEAIANFATSKPPREALEHALAEVHAVQAATKLDPALPVTPVERTAELLGGVEWLWRGWLPKGYLTILAGEPGIGKSFLALYLCKLAVTGEPWPDGQENEAPVLETLFGDAEGCQQLISQRAAMLQVPPNKVFLAGQDGLGRLVLNDKAHLAAVRQLLAERDIGLIVIDSLRSALNAEIDENDSRLAAILTPWAELARDYSIGILLVHHMKKRSEGQGELSLDRLRGSSAIGAIARSVIALDKPDPDDPRARLSVIKSNLGPLPKPLGLRITTDGLLEFDRHAPQPPRRDFREREAEEFLMTMLDHRPMRWSELREAAAAEGISKDALYRARHRLGIITVPDPTDRSGRARLWSLPALDL